MKMASFIAFILLTIADIVLIRTVIKDLRYCNRHVPEDFVVALVGGLLFLSITLYFTFGFACIAFN